VADPVGVFRKRPPRTGTTCPTGGEFIRSVGTGTVSAVGNTFQVGTVIFSSDIEADPERLEVVGTAEDETILFGPGPGAGDVQLKRNGIQLGTFHPTDRLTAHGQHGNDTIQVAGSIALSAWLYGDAGNDRLKGGAGHDVMLGGDGDDLLVGQSGRDMLIGGVGADRIVGNADDDILIAGYLNFINRDAALRAITKEWTSGRAYEIRLLNLYDGSGSELPDNDDYFLVTGEGGTVVEDDESDKLTGSAGLDWFLYSDEDNDRATDLKDEAFADVLEWILAE